MGYSVGDTVVYPHHGAGIVESTERRELHGKPCDYLVLRMRCGDLTLLVPAERCQEVGVRDVVSGDDVERVLDVLRDTHGEKQGSWSRRFKENFERLRSGDATISTGCAERRSRAQPDRAGCRRQPLGGGAADAGHRQGAAAVGAERRGRQVGGRDRRADP